MAATVYFSSLENSKFETPLKKIDRLFKACQPETLFRSKDLIAIKVHFGELGNTAFLRPILLRPILEALRALGTKPFLTDTNTLYVGMRTNSVDHLQNAFLNGFNYSTLQVPVLIADGLKSDNTVEVPIHSKLVKTAKLAADIVHADGMVVVSHFKGHEVSGFGGAIKNLSMGCATRAGKLEMHSQTRPVVDPEKCTACEECKLHCFSEAIEMRPEAFITDRCVGCAHCIAVCPTHAVKINWDQSSDNTQRMMVEYAAATVKALKGKVIYLNILTSISPACDCYPGNDQSLVPDIGYFASLDPIALDKASYELVCQRAGKDPFKATYDYLDPSVQFKHALELSFGEKECQFIQI